MLPGVPLLIAIVVRGKQNNATGDLCSLGFVLYLKRPFIRLAYIKVAQIDVFLCFLFIDKKNNKTNLFIYFNVCATFKYFLLS